MFEYDQKIVQSLLDESDNFRRLYKKHQELKEKVHEAEIGTLPIEDLTLVKWKKEKLLAKDRMAAMIEDYRRGQV